MTDEAPASQWHVSKSIPLTVLIGLAVQGAAFVWYASAMQAQIDGNTKSIERLERDFGTLESASNAQAIQLGRIEEGIKGINSQLSTLTRSLGSTPR
jgi:Tfp pilus assembly protein PilO